MVGGLLMLLRGRAALGNVRLWRRDAILGCGSALRANRMSAKNSTLLTQSKDGKIKAGNQ